METDSNSKGLIDDRKTNGECYPSSFNENKQGAVNRSVSRFQFIAAVVRSVARLDINDHQTERTTQTFYFETASLTFMLIRMRLLRRKYGPVSLEAYYLVSKSKLETRKNVSP